MVGVELVAVHPAQGYGFAIEEKLPVAPFDMTEPGAHGHDLDHATIAAQERYDDLVSRVLSRPGPDRATTEAPLGLAP